MPGPVPQSSLKNNILQLLKSSIPYSQLWRINCNVEGGLMKRIFGHFWTFYAYNLLISVF